MPVDAPVAVQPVARQRWLGALQQLLEPLGPQRLALVRGMVLPERLQWVDSLPAELVVLEPEDAGAHLRNASGWLFPLERRAAHPVLLFMATEQSEPGPDPLVNAAATLCRCAWRLQQGEQADDDIDARALGEAIHGLRNGLNSVLMSAAVVTTCADLLPERLQPIAREIEAAAHRSVDRLHKLTALIEPGR